MIESCTFAYILALQSVVELLPDMISIRRCVAITEGEGNGAACWHALTEVHEGVEYVAITNQDRGFLRFVFNSTNYIKQEKLAILDVIKQRRTEMSLELARSHADQHGVDESLPEPLRRAQNMKRAKILTALGTLPEFVEVDFPSIGELAGVRCKCITSLDSNAVVKVEVREDVIAYIKKALNAKHEVQNVESPPKRLKSQHDGVTWRKQRSGFVASRLKPDGTMEHRLFSPASFDAHAIAEADAEAGEWVSSAAA